MIKNQFDVVICGGGLAGLTLALQLTRSVEGVTVAVVDRLKRPLPEATLKVGESTVETGAHYLTHVLGLKEYFSESHLRKNGFRFFFHNSDGSFEERPELGLSKMTIDCTYQIDRGVLENDLRGFVEKAGVTLLEGWVVADIELSEDQSPHRVICRCREDNQEVGLLARWVVDASGRRKILQRKLGLGKPSKQLHSAVWFRLPGWIDVDNLVPQNNTEWHERVQPELRYLSTNHLMGNGYWVWLIPLGTGNMSVGIVTMEDIHPFKEYNTREKAKNWLRKYEPDIAAVVESLETMDFLPMRDYSYSSRQVFSNRRWSCVGEAGVFADPFYSPGTDMIGFSNTITTDMVKRDIEGTLTPAIVDQYNSFYLSFNEWLTRFIQGGYSFFGQPVVMSAKIMWEICVALSLVTPQMYSLMFIDSEIRKEVRKATANFFLLSLNMQKLFRDWASHSSGKLTFDYLDYQSIPMVLEFHTRNLRAKPTEELLRDLRLNLQRLEEMAQIFFLLAVEDVLPEHAPRLSPKGWYNAWTMNLDPESWNGDNLKPRSAPRDIEELYRSFRTHYRLKDPGELKQAHAERQML
jgi:flavin-dependent dehydrogenase